MSYKIDSQLSENQIESDVASYLGYITPLWSKRFRLISVDEQLTGADKLFNRFFPIYLQFKVSHGLNPNSTRIQRHLNKPLTNIISYRTKNNLSGNPILYFPLRAKAKTASDFQHNILFKLNNPPLQFGLYIAPLTLELTEYEELMNQDWYMKFYPFNPFRQKQLDIHDPSIQKNISFSLNPFLRHHVAIPPHTTVTTHDHHYSFSKSGGDIAWHGGELLNDDFRLSNQIMKIFNYVDVRDGLGIDQNQFIEFIKLFLSDNSIRTSERNQSNEPISDFARILKSEYNIKLLLLTQAN